MVFMASSGTFAVGGYEWFQLSRVGCGLSGCYDLGFSNENHPEIFDSNGVDMVGYWIPDGWKKDWIADHPIKVGITGENLVDLGSLGGDFGRAIAINASGAVVGYSAVTPSSFEYHAFLWDGTMHDLGTLLNEPGAYSSAVAINNSGQVLGASISIRGKERAFLWDGTMHDLGTLGGEESKPMAINNSGQVIGHSQTANGHWHAFFWSDGVMTDLGSMGGTESWVYRHSLNDAGQVVGGGKDVAYRNRGFIWHKGVKRDLGAIGEGIHTNGVAINAAGVVLGNSQNNITNFARAFVVTPGACTTR